VRHDFLDDQALAPNPISLYTKDGP
jgi:hypothetical protein